MGSYSAIWSIPLTNVKWHSDPWPTVTSQPIRLSTNFMTFIPSLTFTDYEWFSMEHLQRVWHASRERLPFRTPGSVPHLDLLMFQLLRPNSLNLPCLYSTFHLEYPLVLSRFCFGMTTVGFLSKVLAFLMRNYFPKRTSGASLLILFKLYDVPAGLVSPLLRQCIAIFAVAEGQQPVAWYRTICLVLSLKLVFWTFIFNKIKKTHTWALKKQLKLPFIETCR